MVTRFVVDADKRFKRAIERAQKAVNDLTIPLVLITREWFRGNRFIFGTTGSSGKYADYKHGGSESPYAKWKMRKKGFIYPMLRLSGTLEDSLTKQGDRFSIAQILNKKVAVLGTSVPYAAYHQTGTDYMKARPPVLWGVEQVADARMGNRQKLWAKMIDKFVKDSQRLHLNGAK